MAGGTRARRFDTSQNKAADLFHRAQDYLTRQRARVALEIHASKYDTVVPALRLADFQRETFTSGAARAMSEAYREAGNHTVNSMAFQDIPWRELRSTTAPVDAASLSLRIGTKSVDFAANESAKLITNIDETTRDGVKGLVRDAVALDWSSDKLAGKLEASGLFSPARAQMIARTEISFALNQGTLEAARQYRDATGRKVLKRWVVDGDPCPECQEAAEEGEQELDDDFGEDGGDAPPLHPNCMCSIELIEPDEDEA